MRAFAVQKFNEAPAIHELPIPAADGAFLIRVRYAGVNPIDFKVVEQLTAASPYPFVMGIDFAGVIERVPPGERDFHVGDRIFGMARTHGAYAEYTVVAPGVNTEPLARTPDGVTDEQAAALPIAGITALRSLELLGVTAGQRLVVMGATGGGWAATRCRWRALAARMSSQRFAGTPTRRAASVPKKFTTPKASMTSAHCARLTRMVSTRSSISSTARTQSVAMLRFSRLEATLSPRFMRQTKSGSLSAKSRRTISLRTRIRCHRRKA